MLRVVSANGKQITYELTRKRVKNINLRVRRDGTVAVSCNTRVSVTEVDRFVAGNAVFIEQAVIKVSERIANSSRPSEYRDGDIVKVFGEEMPVRIAFDRKNSVVPLPDSIIVNVRDVCDPRMIFRTYESWRRKTLQEEILRLCRLYYPFFEQLGVKWPVEIRFRSMKSRWGSCMPSKGIVTFNYNLFEAPKEAASYVVVHEFAHFLKADHSAAFYKIVGSVLPDYKYRRSLLREY
ncbi:MAG: M48 family metallopeptidase [Clostridiales bacterium]|nr:M48 family metallopeptidase [Clostridiales bacterium]